MTLPEAAHSNPSGSSRDFQSEADEHLARTVEGLKRDDAALALAVLANRCATRLHNLAREESTAQKGQPSWASWAALQNASRNLTLTTSTCRDLAAKLVGRRR